MSTTFLRVKIRSLAVEAQIIRREENKYRLKTKVKGEQPKPLYFALRDHRVFDVRKEARYALLAYGFLRGRSYQQMEGGSLMPPDMARVAELVAKYGDMARMEAYAAKHQLPEYVYGKPREGKSSIFTLLEHWMRNTQWPFTVVDNTKLKLLPYESKHIAEALRLREQRRLEVRASKAETA